MARHLGCQGERRLDHSEDGRSSRNLTRGAPSIQELLVLTLCCRGRDLLGALRVDQWEPGRRVDHALPTRCCVLQVSRSGFYAWQHRPLSPRAQRDVPLRVRFRSFHARSRGRYGIHVQRSGVGGGRTRARRTWSARVAMSTTLAETLEARLADAKAAMLKAGDAELVPWVFANRDGESLDGNNLRKQRIFHPALAKAKLRQGRFHDRLHTFASLLIPAGGVAGLRPRPDGALVHSCDWGRLRTPRLLAAIGPRSTAWTTRPSATPAQPVCARSSEGRP